MGDQWNDNFVKMPSSTFNLNTNNQVTILLKLSFNNIFYLTPVINLKESMG